MRNLRRITQGIFFLIFLFLFVQTESKGGDALGYPVKIWLDFDPLIFISTLLSSHSVTKGLFLALVVIVVTIFMGRIFCGWICPLGTLHTMVGSLRKKPPATVRHNWYRIKYYILLVVLASSLFTAQLAGIMDPISLLIRSLSLSIYPLVNYMTISFFDMVYNLHLPGIVAVSEFFYTIAKKTFLSFNQPYFFQGILIGFLFVIILGLNLIERRFWCKYLCPLGALLGILSRYSLLKRSISEGCTSCGVCETKCSGGAVVDKDGTWRGPECLYCMDCDDFCPHNAVNFGFTGKTDTVSLNLGRRNVITSIFAGILIVPFLRIRPLSGSGYFNRKLIRPPGSLDEGEFLKKCIRCGECMKVCITNGLQPTLFDAGMEGIWTPKLVPRVGYCEYRCTLCGQVCPTGAIRRLTLKEKENTKIGVAMIDKGRCLPYAFGTPCLVCEEVCPTPKKSIWLEQVLVRNRDGKDMIIKQPKVDITLCVGCGICETFCPVKSAPAIYVISTNESRSTDNKLLLD
ncbi:MAG: 4Fe-4S binding protein [Deltaproteobacteria bacterium]|nr:4Fe-4S binding protein [Deltaproteobacteria bacterium]